MEPMKPAKAKPEHGEGGEATEAPKEPEITQTDQINKAMLNSFKAMLDSNQFRFPESAQKGGDEDESDEFADDGKYEGEEELYSMDPEKAEAQRQQAVAFFREMLTHAAAENAAASTSSAPKP